MVSEVEHERLVVELLSRAVELEGSARSEYLDAACLGDPALRAELDSMLEEDHTTTDDFLATPAVANLALEDTQFFDADAGRSLPKPHWIGPYRVLETLGQGGMGTVYLGEQEEPVRRRAALKVLDSIDDRQRLRRFSAECQALAHLHHPNVASLYEVGTTDREYPYVAMEPVDGTAITFWCDERRLPLEERIRLFFGVCAGVRHAHEKGILHRDLKPANVLVTEIDGQPTAKVIDFGIARALGEPLHSGTQPMTLDHQIIGSPAYMCPEIAAGERELDTRSDVYSLGLLLYELLAGTLPFDIRKIGLMNLLRRIAGEQPPRLSARYAELDLELRQQIAASRSLASPRQLSSRLSGDLDAIVEKSLALDPDDRYSSPADLAADLERHVDMRPVTVRAASARYRAWRFVHRHRAMVASGMLLVSVLVMGMVGTAREARRASHAAERANHEMERTREALAQAQQLSGFLVDLFEIADPERGREGPADVLELLDRSAEKLQDELRDQPLTRALFLHTIGEIYTKMALFEPAEALATKALEIRERELPADHPDVLKSVNQLGVVYRRQDRLDEAEPLLRRVLTAREARADEPLAIGLALNNLGNLFWSRRQFDEAEALHRRALEIREHELGAGHRDVAETYNNLGALYQTQAKHREAEPELLKAVEIFAGTMSTDHPRYAATLFNLSLVQTEIGRWQEAEHNCRQAAAIWEAAYGRQHPRTVAARTQLADQLRKNGRYGESLRVYLALLSAREETTGIDDLKVRNLLRKVAMLQGELGDFASAEIRLQQLLGYYLENRGVDHSSTIGARANLAWLAWRRGDVADAETALRAVLRVRRLTLDPKHRLMAWTLHYLALTVADQGRHDEAKPLLREALEIREATAGEDPRGLADSLHELGHLMERVGHGSEARRLLDRALEIRRRSLPDDHPDLQRTVEALAIIGPESEGAANATGVNR